MLAAQPAPPAYDSARILAAVDSAVAASRVAERAPGVVVAVLRGGTLVVRARGAAAERAFHVGSVTKQVTAAAVLQLVDAGRVALDDTVQRFLWLDTGGRRVTIRMLLTHTSGVRGGFPIPADGAARVPFDFAPGTDWSYSNAGYAILGRVIGRVTGAPYADAVARFASPLGLRSLRPCDDSAAARAFAAGGLCATAADLVRWSDALARGRVVSRASYALMTTPTTLPDGRTIPYGAGLQVDSLGAHVEHMHEGAIRGFTAATAYYPSDSLAVAVLTDGDDTGALRVARAVAGALLGASPPAPRDLPLGAAERARYLGLYGVGSIACRVVAVDDGIGYTCGGGDVPRRMLYQGDGRFVEREAPEWAIAFLPDGSSFRELYFGLPFGLATRVAGAPEQRP